MRILITGASGLIGQAMLAALRGRHDLIALSRKRIAADTPAVLGDFAHEVDLRKIPAGPVDAVLHLGAVTGGCSERDGLLVNVEGTRVLSQHLIARGCRKFVYASSIAVVGLQSPAFRPVAVPIADDHGCLDRHGYGLSKYLMEQVTHYLARQHGEIDIINLRLASVPGEKLPHPTPLCDLTPWAPARLTHMRLGDAVRAFALALEAPHRAGVRTMNATPRWAWAAAPTGDILRRWWGGSVDLAWYQRPGHERDGLFATALIERELGFVCDHRPPAA